MSEDHSVVEKWSSRVLLLILLCGISSACGTELEPRESPNVILVTLDTFRADLLASYGGDPELMPFLNSVADRAVVFDRATTTIGTTHPAHASMFTGKHPYEHGVRWNGVALRESETTLAERLKAHGYRTAAFVSKPGLMIFGGFEQGFDLAESSPDGFARTGADTTDALAAWLASQSDGRSGENERPLFLWVHYFDTHAPYPLTDWINEKLGTHSSHVSDGATTKEFYSFGREKFPANEENRRAIGILYHGMAKVLDRQVERLFALLEEHQILEESVVVIVSDHGQLLGEHDLVGHGFRLNEEVISIPMLFIDEASHSMPSRVRTRVSVVDLLPTLLDRLDLDGLPGDDELPGRSLVPLLSGSELAETVQLATVRFATAKNKAPMTNAEEGKISAYLGDWKIVRTGDVEEIYDLVRDPRELGLVSDGPTDPKLLSELRRAARSYQQADKKKEEPVDLSPEHEEELKALGYLETGG